MQQARTLTDWNVDARFRPVDAVRARDHESRSYLQCSAVELTSLGYQTDLAVLWLGGTQVEDRGDHLVVRSPHNPTHWWGNFLLLAQVPAPEASKSWLDRFAATFPAAEHVARIRW